MIDRRAFVCATLAATACATTTNFAVPTLSMRPLWVTLTPGPYAPGFQLDWLTNGSRRIQRWRWHPAQPGSGSAMSVRDYGAAYVARGPGGWPTDPRAIYATGYDEPGDAEKFARLLDLGVAARKNARAARGEFPLVVLGQGFGFESPFHQHVLAEYLASWGYRVVTTPLTGANGPKTDVSPATLSAEVEDLRFLAASERRASGLALIGYDLGGMAVVALAGSGLVKPDLVMGIDTGLMSERLTGDLITSRPDFAWNRLTMPYVHFTRIAAENQARNLPETLKIFEQNNGASRSLVRVPQMRHADFGTIGAIEHTYPAMFGPVQGNPALGYANTVYLIRDALDHFVRRRSQAEWKPLVPAPLTIQPWPDR
jgi:hypothetical protein